MPEHPTRLLFVTLTNDAGTDRIVSAMGRAGLACAVLGRPDSFAALSRFAGAVHALPGAGGALGAAWGVRQRLGKAARTWRPDLVVPLDDFAAVLLRGLALDRRVSLGLRALLLRSFGRADGYRTASSREALMEAASRLGLRTPAHRPAPSLAAALSAAADLGYPVVLKRDQTCGGSGVTIASDAAALRAAFRDASRKAALKRWLQRGLRLPLADGAGSLSLQQFIPGRLAMRTLACVDGRVIEGVSFEAERLHPAGTGSSSVIRHVEHPEMDEAAKTLVAHLGCSGFVSFDFLLDGNDDAHLIEMNARPVGSGHLGALFAHDVYGAFLAHGRGHTAPVGPCAGPRAIALFPKELDRDPLSPSFQPGSGVYHDLPADEPRVLAAYLEQLTRAHPEQAETIRRLALAEPALDAAASRASCSNPFRKGRSRLSDRTLFKGLIRRDALG